MTKSGAAASQNAPSAEEESKDEAVNTSGSDDHNKSTGGSSGSGSGTSTGNLFAVGESQDKGLAEYETGSEVYMSELLVSKNCESNEVFVVGY